MVGEAEHNDKPNEVMSDLVDGKKRVLFNFAREFWKRNQDDNLSQLARKWGFPSGGGHFPLYVNELAEKGYLKRVEKNGKRYIRITGRGEIAIFPLILPKLLMVFTMIVALALIDEVIPPLMVRVPLDPDYILAIGLLLLGFSLVGFFMINRMEKFLLKPVLDCSEVAA